MKIIVYHNGYGCDTGCCGHVVEVSEGVLVGGLLPVDEFHFEHPSEKQDYREFAENLVRETYGEEHVKDLDWENCAVLYD